MKYSRQNEIIFEYIKQSGEHPSAELIHEKIKDHGIALGTVYRNLGRMTSKGIIKKLSGLSQSALYDMNQEPHYHMVCRECGTVIDIPLSAGEGVINKAIKESGLQIDSCEIVFRGLCIKCNAQNNKGGKIL